MNGDVGDPSSHGSGSNGSKGSGGSSDPATEDPELAAALDSFVDWARHGDGGARIPELPPLQLNEGLEPGAVLGDYELVQRLGIGGMGVVFEARQLSVAGRRVAVKVLRALFATERLARRFQREIATVADLDHPGIVPIVDARVEGGTPYYVMKFVDGVSIDRIVKKLRREPRLPLDTSAIRKSIVGVRARRRTDHDSSSGSGVGSGAAWESSYVLWVARLGLQVAEALHYAHERGFVHRDVKPGNVMITPSGRPVLLDFGLATGLDDEPITQTGEFLGTLAYAPPEQVLGRQVDARADVYSLGATLYELLTLAKPFDARDRSDLLRRIEKEDPRRIGAEVPFDLRTIVACAMSKAPGRRYATAAAMAQDLRAFLAGRAIRARPPSLLSRARRWVRSHPLLATAAGVTLLVVAGMRAEAHRRARERLLEGERILTTCLAEERELLGRLEHYTSLRGADPPEFLALSAEREAMGEARGRVEDGFEQARSALQAAFEHVADYSPARSALAQLCSEELTHSLRMYDDLLHPARLERIEEMLERYDDSGRHAGLLHRLGRVRIECSAPGATIEIRRDPETAGEGDVLHSATSLFEQVLEEGSYVARIRAPGHAAATLPFLVRRDACYDVPGARPAREHRVELLRDADLPAGFVYVPAGDALVEDDPPVWESVPSFLIQRHETTNAELVGWLTELEASGAVGARFVAAAASYLPRDSEGWHVERGPAGEWDLRHDVQADWPVRGLSAMDLGFHTDAVELLSPVRPPGWYVSVPRLFEWIRAARGADGRRHPWGSVFERERCVSYLSGGHFGRDARPLPAGSRPGDCSPFGVQDLAGSVAEWTWDLHVPLPGNYAVCGGSFRSWDPDALSCKTVRALPNEPFQDVGFRLVMRPLPAWCREPDPPRRAFDDDFQRPDADEVGNGWIELAGVPLGLSTNPSEPERCSIANGRLVCLGGVGDFSESSTALHRIHVSEEGLTALAVLRASHQSSPGATLRRSFGIKLSRGFVAPEREALSLAVDFDGRPELTWSATGQETVRGTGPRVPVAGLLRLELRVRADEAEARVWQDGTERPEEPLVAIRLPPEHRSPRYLLLTAPNYIGARVEVDRVAVDSAP